MSEETPTWATVAPLLARWRMALVPQHDGTWDVLTGYDSRLLRRVFDARQVPWNQVPQTIMDLAARCEAAAGEGEA